MNKFRNVPDGVTSKLIIILFVCFQGNLGGLGMAFMLIVSFVCAQRVE